MIQSSNRSVYIGDTGTGTDFRHLITIIYSGKMSFWCKKADGTTEYYRTYNYLSDGSGHSIEWAGLVAGTGAYRYLVKHDISEVGTEISDTIFANTDALPKKISGQGSTWAIGDFATVRTNNIYNALGQYAIAQITDAGDVYWEYAAPIRGLSLGRIIGKENLPTEALYDTQRVGNYYTVSGGINYEDNGNYIITSIVEGKIAYGHQYPIVNPYIMTEVMDCDTNEVVECNVTQMADYLELNFGAAIPVGRKFLVHIIKPDMSSIEE